jgi:multidrug efflux pump subunit AcrA (membrane-fusion protein)
MNSCTRLAAVMVLGLPVAAGAADAPKPLPVPVEVATARLQAVTPRTWIPGSIVSRDDARVASVVAGRVIAIAEVGQRVGAGARLAKLDDTLLKLRLADLAAQVARARAQQDLARTQLERFRQLAATHALSTSQLDDARAQQDMAGQDVARLTAQFKQAEYDSAESEIRAPFPGIVTERFAQRGEFLQAGAPVVRLVNASDTEARATAALVLAANVRPGQQVAVASGDWLVGTPIDISVPTAVERQAITVPRDALVIRQNRSYVLRVTPAETVEELEVTPGDALVDVVEVRGPVGAGDRLVVRGAEHLSAGQRVTIVPTAAHSSAARLGRPG